MSGEWPVTLPEEVVSILTHCGIVHPMDVLTMSESQLSNLISLSRVTCREILLEVAKLYSAPAIPLEKLPRCRISTGLGSLDKLFYGGLQPGWLVEVFGESASGKTQFCFNTVVHSLVHRTVDTVFWIDTEGTFRPDRVQAMIRASKEGIDEEEVENLLTKMKCCKCVSLVDLLERISVIGNYLKSTSMGGQNTHLVVVDSVAYVARDPTLPSATRQSLLHALALSVKGMTNCVTIVTNHVIADMSRTVSCSSSMKAALGTTWAHDVTCRVRMRRLDGPQREIEILKNPHGVLSNVFVEICHTGLRDSGEL